MWSVAAWTLTMSVKLVSEKSMIRRKELFK